MGHTRIAFCSGLGLTILPDSLSDAHWVYMKTLARRKLASRLGRIKMRYLVYNCKQLLLGEF